MTAARTHTIIESPIGPLTLVATAGILSGIYMHHQRYRRTSEPPPTCARCDHAYPGGPAMSTPSNHAARKALDREHKSDGTRSSSSTRLTSPTPRWRPGGVYP